MNRLLLIAFSNLKKKRGSMIITTLLITFATLLLYISTTTLTNIQKNIDKHYNYCNLADVEFVVPEVFCMDARPIIHSESGISAAEEVPALYYLSAKYSNNNSKDTTEFGVLAESIENDMNLSRITYQGDIKDFPENGVVLNQYLESNGIFKVGDIYTLTLDKHHYNFKVCGFSEDGIFANPVNLSVQKIFITPAMMEKIEKDNEQLNLHATDFKLKLSDSSAGNKVEKSITANLYNEMPELANTSFLGANWYDLRT